MISRQIDLHLPAGGRRSLTTSRGDGAPPPLPIALRASAYGTPEEDRFNSLGRALRIMPKADRALPQLPALYSLNRVGTVPNPAGTVPQELGLLSEAAQLCRTTWQNCGYQIIGLPAWGQSHN